jgi:membrane-associated protease RseP (regulator of RpoE activity)
MQPDLRRQDPGPPRWGGAHLKPVTPELQQKLGLPENEGLSVAAVEVNSPAANGGLKVNDILIKINNKAVPGDMTGLGKLLGEQKANEPMELVVLRGGKEETLKDARMPALVQNDPAGGIRRLGQPGQPGLPGFPGGGIPMPRININGRPLNPLQPAVIKKLHVEMDYDGGTLIRKQDGDQFSGEFAKGELKIAIAGKIENRQNKVNEIAVTQGKETSKYANLRDVPAQHQRLVQQLLPQPLQNMMLFPGLPMMPEFPPEFLPLFPEFPK